MSRIVTAALIVIGNEILSGRTRDSNLPYLAAGLNGIGVRLREVRVVPDDEAAIVAAVNALRAAHDYVFATGGIGPTHDDITAASVAKAFGVPLERNAFAVARLEAHYAKSDLELNEARLRMAEMPEGAELIGTAAPDWAGLVWIESEPPRLADLLGAERRLLVGLGVHEDELVAVVVEELHPPVLDVRLLQLLPGAEAPIEHSTGLQVLQLGSHEGAALAGLHVLEVGDVVRLTVELDLEPVAEVRRRDSHPDLRRSPACVPTD